MQDAKKKSAPKSAPHLTYMPIAARSELIRMLASLGGIEISEGAEADAEMKAVHTLPLPLSLLRCRSPFPGRFE